MKGMLRFSTIALAGLLAAGVLANVFIPPSAGQGYSETGSGKAYLTAKVDDPVSRLQKRLDRGEAHLEWYGRHGFLRAVLRELNISPASQVLVFSKTSLQRNFISPQTPRAVYFNDESYVAWIPDAPMLEISTTDPRWGGNFYTIVQNETDKTNPSDRPRLFRQTFDCISCHQSALTENVPGPTVRSVYALADGTPELSLGSTVSTDASPIKDRWGGWYVTGTHGRQRHMGNVVARGSRSSEDGITLDRDAGANVTDLAGRLDTHPYLSPHSDIVALLVLEHQTLVHNRITRANYLVRDALRDEQVMNKADGKPLEERRSATTRRIESAVEPLVQALLFSGAAPFTDPVKGTSDFAREFMARDARCDKQGRSLRDLDLNRRLLRYPCSYVIYSEAFDALPAAAREYVFRRLAEITDGKDTKDAKDADETKETDDPFAALSRDDRRAIDEILRETKPDYAAWRAAHP